MIKKGLVLFLESNQSLEMTASENEDIEAYQAFCWDIIVEEKKTNCEKIMNYKLKKSFMSDMCKWK